MIVEGKRILLGVTGSIAAYKTALLIRQLRQAGAQVRVLMSSSAQTFVTPLTFQSLSGNPVETELFTHATNDGMRHIELARWADLFLVAPASANTIGKMAHGTADDIISTTYLAAAIPVAVAPAMNRVMWEHPATQSNMQTLSNHGINIWGPAVGTQACGDEGAGRMLEAEDLAAHIDALFGERLLNNVRVTVTAGPTHEPIDAVRYLSNHSSGKMGFALARSASALGAKTTLISGPTALVAPPAVNRIDVVSAENMYAAVQEQLSNCDILIACAAVADYRPTVVQSGKMKKSRENWQLTLVRTTDILDQVARLPQRPFLVGFAAETDSILTRAKAKLLQKNLDMVIANQVGNHTSYGFNSDNNEVTALWHGGSRSFAPESKNTLAVKLMALITEHFQAQQNKDREADRSA